jgi:hypothetical protein
MQSLESDSLWTIWSWWIKSVSTSHFKSWRLMLLGEKVRTVACLNRNTGLDYSRLAYTTLSNFRFWILTLFTHIITISASSTISSSRPSVLETVLCQNLLNPTISCCLWEGLHSSFKISILILRSISSPCFNTSLVTVRIFRSLIP